MKPLTLISRLAVIEMSLAGYMLNDETLRKIYGTYATCEEADVRKTEQEEYEIYNNSQVSLVSKEVLYILDNSGISTNPPDKIITREEFEVFKEKICEKYMGAKFKKTKIKL